MGGDLKELQVVDLESVRSDLCNSEDEIPSILIVVPTPSWWHTNFHRSALFLGVGLNKCYLGTPKKPLKDQFTTLPKAT